MRRRTTFIDVYRYRKNRHAVLSRRGGVDRLPLRNEEVRGSIPLGSTTASPDTVATICLLPEALPDEFGATRPPTRPRLRSSQLSRARGAAALTIGKNSSCASRLVERQVSRAPELLGKSTDV